MKRCQRMIVVPSVSLTTPRVRARSLLPARSRELIGAGFGRSPKVRCIEVILAGDADQGELGIAPGKP